MQFGRFNARDTIRIEGWGFRWVVSYCVCTLSRALAIDQSGCRTASSYSLLLYLYVVVLSSHICHMVLPGMCCAASQRCGQSRLGPRFWQRSPSYWTCWGSCRYVHVGGPNSIVSLTPSFNYPQIKISGHFILVLSLPLVEGFLRCHSHANKCDFFACVVHTASDQNWRQGRSGNKAMNMYLGLVLQV